MNRSNKTPYASAFSLDVAAEIDHKAKIGKPTA